MIALILKDRLVNGPNELLDDPDVSLVRPMSEPLNNPIPLGKNSDTLSSSYVIVIVDPLPQHSPLSVMVKSASFPSSMTLYSLPLFVTFSPEKSRDMECGFVQLDDEALDDGGAELLPELLDET